jgi:stage V sporulation protein SpoVS
MVQTVVVNHPDATSLNSSDLGQVDNFGQNSITVTHAGNKSYKYDPETNQVTKGGVSSYQPEETSFISASGNYSATFDPNGSVVLPGGITTSAKVAMKMGMISEQGQPTAQASPQQAPQQGEQQPQSTDAHESFAMSSGENQIVDDALPANLVGSQVQVVMNQSTEAAVTGNFDKVVSTLVQSAGISPSEAADRVNQAYSAYAKAGERYLENVVGLKDADDRANFYSWAQESAPQALRGAVAAMIQNNRFQELGKLVGQWADSVPPTIEALQKAGYKTGKSSDGTETVFVPGFGEVAVSRSMKYL